MIYVVMRIAMFYFIVYTHTLCVHRFRIVIQIFCFIAPTKKMTPADGVRMFFFFFYPPSNGLRRAKFLRLNKNTVGTGAFSDSKRGCVCVVFGIDALCCKRMLYRSEFIIVG